MEICPYIYPHILLLITYSDAVHLQAWSSVCLYGDTIVGCAGRLVTAYHTPSSPCTTYPCACQHLLMTPLSGVRANDHP